MRAGDGDRGSRHALHQPLLHADAAEAEPRRRAEDSGGDEHRHGYAQLSVIQKKKNKSEMKSFQTSTVLPLFYYFKVKMEQKTWIIKV